MKKFCILEQGGLCNEQITIEKKNLFTTQFSDFYRLNWRTENDPYAFITRKNITWSEGRSFLYESVPKNYDYYIFIDDDIVFNSDGEDIASTIQELLIEYKPLTGTFFNWESWGFKGHLNREVTLAKKAFPISGYDQQVQIFSKSFADVMFPVPYHGARRSMWYSQWACHKLFPFKQLCLTKIQVKGIRSSKQASTQNFLNYMTFSPYDEITLLFNHDVFDKSFNFAKSQVIANNLAIFDSQPDKTEVQIYLSDLAKLYDINNLNFKHRTSLANNSYKRRLLFKRLRYPRYLIRKLYSSVKNNIVN